MSDMIGGFPMSPRWAKVPQDKPKENGTYWGVCYFVNTPMVRQYQWQDEWVGETPFYFWTERLPAYDWPLSNEQRNNIENEIRGYE